mmetsp:Transcript_28839/g.60301  ORF Transcript_28839/g.60301 Transcript_28839/m.60301 type:complete len:284 (-) Transcript_28839:59-910(-)
MTRFRALWGLVLDVVVVVVVVTKGITAFQILLQTKFFSTIIFIHASIQSGIGIALRQTGFVRVLVIAIAIIIVVVITVVVGTITSFPNIFTLVFLILHLQFRVGIQKFLHIGRVLSRAIGTALTAAQGEEYQVVHVQTVIVTIIVIAIVAVVIVILIVSVIVVSVIVVVIIRGHIGATSRVLNVQIGQIGKSIVRVVVVTILVIVPTTMTAHVMMMMMRGFQDLGVLQELLTRLGMQREFLVGSHDRGRGCSHIGGQQSQRQSPGNQGGKSHDVVVGRHERME